MMVTCEWFSVYDKLPKEKEEVFIIGLDFGEGPGKHYARCEYYENEFWEKEGDCKTDTTLDHVTHWMHLPEAPK